MASGQTLAALLPTDNLPPASAFATLDTRNGHPVLDFDGSADESAIFKFLLPSAYAGGGLTVTLTVGFSSATSGTSRWTAAIERDNTDLDADSFASDATAVSIAANGTSGITTDGALTFASGAAMDSLAAGEWGRLRVKRLSNSDGADDITTDAELFGVAIKET